MPFHEAAMSHILQAESFEGILGQAWSHSFDCNVSKCYWCGFVLMEQVIVGLEKVSEFLILALKFQCSVDSLIQIGCKRKT
jgi:hypothetical protein